jgi:hypothetical protein
VLPDDFPEGYDPIKPLGEGSMGEVWLAFSRRVQGHCAVKVLLLDEERRNTAERSFNREVRAMARLEHPSVVEVHDFGRTPKGSPFMAMEFVQGASLNHYVRGSWTWPRLWTLLDGLLAGLGHAHAHELIHRDLKPGNVLVLPHVAGPSAIKLVDFGIALAVGEAAKVGRRIEGTPAYIAPEAASGEVAAVGPWTDLYSLGVILYEILSGDVPFHGKHLLTHHQRSPLPPLRIRPEVEVPGGLVQVVEQLLEKSPVRRLRSVAEVRAALARHVGEPPVPLPLGHPVRAAVSWDDDSTHAPDVAGLKPLRGPAGPALFHLRRPPLVGRRPAQRTLREAAEKVLAGEGPRVVLIEGEAGPGQEPAGRLATRVARRAGPDAHHDHAQRAANPHRRRPAAGGAALRGRPHRHPRDRRGPARGGLPRPPPPAKRPRSAVARPQHGSGDAPEEGGLAHPRSGGEQPFMLWADDVQWSPEARALQLIHRLAAWPDRASGLLLVVTLRPSERTTVRKARRNILALPFTDHIKLKPLKPQDLGPALSALAPLPPGIAEAASVQAAGNPLLALEAVRSFLEDEGLAQAPIDPLRLLRQRIERATQGEGGGRPQEPAGARHPAGAGLHPAAPGLAVWGAR